MIQLIWNFVSLLVGTFLSLLLVSIIILYAVYYAVYFIKELKKAASK